MVDKKSWFVVHTKPMREGEVNLRLGDQGFETLLPLCHVKRRCGTRYVADLRAAFPRYLFVAISHGQSLRPINSTFGVSTVIYGLDGPAIVPEKIITSLRERMKPDERGRGTIELPAPAVWPKVGDRARVTSGPFEDFVGEIARLDGDSHVQLFLSLFRRTITARLSLAQIEAAA